MAKPKFAVELKSGHSPASFMAGGKAVELTDENPRFETGEASEYYGIRDLPFLKDLGEIKSGAKSEKAEGDS